jgi:FixJ family two-component response regulator
VRAHAEFDNGKDGFVLWQGEQGHPVMTDHRSPITEVKPTVFVIDDDASVRRSLTRLLGSMGYEAETFASARLFLARQHFDGVGCILLDVRMPGMSGMDLQEELRQADNRLPIVFITGHGDIPMSVQAMKRGAADFLTKPFDDEQLLDAVKKAIEKDSRAKLQDAEVNECLGRIRLLTPRENEILRYVITGILNKQIASKLHIAEKTVKVHRGRIMEKLCVGSVAELVRLCGKAGIEPIRE